MAIDDLLDEHEQSERVRNWLKNNGAGLVGGVALGLAVIFGWQWWQRQQAQQAQAQHMTYRSTVASAAGADLDKAEKELSVLRQGDSSAYANLAALRLVSAQVVAGETDKAIETLKSIDAVKDPALRSIVDLRLARLLIEAGKPEEALAALKDSDGSAVAEARGDALVATGKRDEAREAYLNALTTMDVAAPQRRLVELKLTDVGGTPPNPAEPT